MGETMGTEEEISKQRALFYKKLDNVNRLKDGVEMKHKSLRQKMREDIIIYSEVKEHQKEAFFTKTVKRWAELKADKELQEELWQEFWIEFSEDRVYSIRAFMESKGYSYPSDCDKYLIFDDLYKEQTKKHFKE
jgi:hypothetical protein